jgi:heme-degrading monooxygenase HmoA
MSDPSRFAPRPELPYYAVIFTALRNHNDAPGYEAAAARMVELAATMPGYIGVESTRDELGLGITVSYWQSLADIDRWRKHAEHTAARASGRKDWYDHYELRVARIERDYGWDRSDGPQTPNRWTP